METPDADLVRQCLQGDNSGFDALVKRYQKRVYGFCCRMLGDMEYAADAAQESFVKAYYALESFRPDASFLPWLLKIANNTCIDTSRKRARRHVEQLDDVDLDTSSGFIGDLSPEEDMLKSETTGIIRKAILNLPVKHRTILIMFYYSGLSIKDISKATGRPEGTVKYDLHAAREMLRHKLEGVTVEV